MTRLLNAGQPPPAILTKFDRSPVGWYVADEGRGRGLAYPGQLATDRVKLLQFVPAVPRDEELTEPPSRFLLQLLFLLRHLSELGFVRLQVRDKLPGGPACEAESFLFKKFGLGLHRLRWQLGF